MFIRISISLQHKQARLWFTKIIFMKKLNSLKYLLSVLIISMVIFACSKSTNYMSTGSPNTVSVKNMAFSPASLSVTPGTTVTWVNNDGVAHTVTADDGTFDSGSIAP